MCLDLAVLYIGGADIIYDVLRSTPLFLSIVGTQIGPI